MGLAIKQDYPEVEDVVRVNDYAANFLITVGDKPFSLHGEFADLSFFSMFSFPLLGGKSHTALSSLNSIVLKQQLAIKLFDKEVVVGKTICIDSSDYFTVSAVMKDLTSNTRFN